MEESLFFSFFDLWAINFIGRRRRLTALEGKIDVGQTRTEAKKEKEKEEEEHIKIYTKEGWSKV